MPKFEVHIQEVYVRTVMVDASNKESAREKVSDMLADDDDGIALIPARYSHTANTDEWPVLLTGDYTFEVTVPGDQVRTYTVHAPDYPTAREKAAEELEREHGGGNPGYTAPTADIQDWPARIINDVE